MFASYEHFLRPRGRGAVGRARRSTSASTRAPGRRSPTRGSTELVAGLLRGRGGRRRAPRAPSVDGPRRARCFARPAARRGAPRAVLRPLRGAPSGWTTRARTCPTEFLELFEVRLPEAAAGAPGEAVGLYHMVLEGVVFTAGQLALLDLVDDRLPGLTAGHRARCCATSAGTSASARAACAGSRLRRGGDPGRGRARGGAVGARVGGARVDGCAAAARGPAAGSVGGAVTSSWRRRRSRAPSPRSSSCTRGSARSRCGATSRRGWRRRPAGGRCSTRARATGSPTCRACRARRASCTRRRSTSCPSCCARRHRAARCSSATATAARSR